MAQVQEGSRRAPPLSRWRAMSQKQWSQLQEPQGQRPRDELCPATWLGVPVAKLPANTTAAMCVMAGMGTVWVLDRHVVLLWTARSGMRIVTVNSCSS